MDETDLGLVGAGAIIVPKLYNDLMSPTIKAMGQTGEKIYKALVASIDAWADNKRTERFKKLQDDIANNLLNIPPEKISDKIPEYILVPAISAWNYSIDREELRKIYASLISNSLLTEKQNSVHPAFVEIVKNMHPDEANLFSYIYGLVQIPMLFTIWAETSTTYVYTSKRNIALAPSSCSTAFPSNQIIQTFHKLKLTNPSYFDNLCRLGLIRILDTAYIAEDILYQPLLRLSIIREDEEKCRAQNKEFRIVKGMAEITPLGFQFGDVCIAPIKCL